MSARERILALRRSSPVILPSLLLCDFGNLEREIRTLEAAGTQALHLDVMDGHFVPNFTYGMTIVEAVRRVTDLPLDVHLMISDPGRYLQAFVDAGADMVTFHAEAVLDAAPLLTRLREAQVAGGVVIDPATSVSTVGSVLDLCDALLVMSVKAGFGGQSFDASVLEKFSQARVLGPDDLLLEIDGGVNLETIGSCARAGAQWMVVGSGIFRHDDYGQAMNLLTETARAALQG